MPLLIKLSATLREKFPGYDPLAGLDLAPVPGETVAGLLARLSLAPEDVKVIMVNGRAADLQAPLADGDRVGLFPAVGGG